MREGYNTFVCVMRIDKGVVLCERETIGGGKSSLIFLEFINRYKYLVLSTKLRYIIRPAN
jgi:hypothetical protein